MVASERSSERDPGIRPGPSGLRRLDAAGRRLLPTLSTLLAVFLLAFPIGLPGDPEFVVVLVVISVFFWSIYRPASMPPVAAFLIGLLCDLLGPAPPGIAMVTLVALNGTAVRVRIPLIRQGFLMIWLAFVAMAAASFTAIWVLTACLEWRLVPVAPALFELALASGLYPLLALLLIRLHAGIAAPERA
jgi:rod shape-determining protein MreD